MHVPENLFRWHHLLVDPADLLRGESRYHVLDLDVRIEIHGLELESDRAVGGRVGYEESVCVDDLDGRHLARHGSDCVGLEAVLNVEETLDDSRMDVKRRVYLGLCRGNLVHPEAEVEFATALGAPAGVETIHVAASYPEDGDSAHHFDPPGIDDAFHLDDFVRAPT